MRFSKAECGCRTRTSWTGRTTTIKCATHKAEAKVAREVKDSTKSHCQICGRLIQSKLGVIAHHGYKRPGHGWQTPSCLGARELPYEESRDAIPGAITTYENAVNFRTTAINTLVSAPPDKFVIPAHWKYGKRIEEKTLLRPDGFDPAKTVYSVDHYGTEYRSRKYTLETEIKALTAEIEYLTKRYDAWVSPASKEA